MSSELVSWYYKTFSLTCFAENRLPWPQEYTHIVPFVAVVLYLLMLKFLPKIVGQPKKIDGIFAVWNLFLSIMSLAILLGVLIPYFEIIKEKGFIATLCDKTGEAWKPDPLLFWCLIFAYSKYFELLDTFFVILKNPSKPVDFLHWYHHTTVLLFTWYAFTYQLSISFIYGTVNALVHTFMYFYYFLSAIGMKPSNTVAFFLTSLQILQMFFGIYVNITWTYLWYNGEGCHCDNAPVMVASGLIMYGSYLILFIQFFIKRYLSKQPPRENTKTK